MPIIRVNDHAEIYRLRSHSSDLHSLAVRDGRPAVTEFVNSQILQRLAVKPADVLVDVGCGDGCMLRKADYVRTRIGTAGSQDECDRLTREIPGVIFKPGLLHSLPLDTESADKVVCNGVFHYLQTTDGVEKALRELARIAKPNGEIWVGEIPTVDEYEKFRVYCGTSVAGLLWYLLRKHGIRTFLGMCRRVMKAVLGKEQLILNSAALYYSSPKEFVSLAEKCGLRLVAKSKHRELNPTGEVVELDERYNYLLHKQAV